MSGGELNPTQRPSIAFMRGAFHELRERVDAFYSFFELGGRLLAVYRRFNLDIPELAFEQNRYRSELFVGEIDRSTRLLVPGSERFLCFGEDPRVVSNGERAFVLCKGALHHDPLDTFKLVALPSGVEVPVRMPEGLAPGKNWQPFLKDGELFVVQGFAPLTVLSLDESGRVQVHVHRPTEYWIPATHDRFTVVRGGSNAVAVGDSVVGFGHLSLTRHEHRPFLWKLDADFRMTLVLPDEFLGLRDKGFRIVDPTSLTMQDNRIYLGVCASEREWFYPQRFLNLLVEVPLSRNESLESGSFVSALRPLDLGDVPKSRTFIPSGMPHDIAVRSYPSGVGSDGCEAGCLLHGPYAPIEEERTYTASLCFAASLEPDARAEPDGNRFEICFHRLGRTDVVAAISLPDTHGQPTTASLTYSTKGRLGWQLETRVHVAEGSDLRALNIRVVET